jgi:HEAT repeat protein
VFLLSDVFRAYLLLFLQASGGMLLLLFGAVLVRHLREQRRQAREERLRARYQPLVDGVLTCAGEVTAEAREELRAVPARERGFVGRLLVAPLRVSGGTTVDAASAACEALGLVDRWMADLGGETWWQQAEAARCLGLLRVRRAFKPLLACLENDHEEVRAAAVDALGRLGDADCVPALLAALPDASRHQRARVVEALRELGPQAAYALIAHARVRPDDLAMVAELVGFTGAAAATGDLLAWCAHEDAKVRAASLQALGSLGLDDRSYYYTLRALGDDVPAVRAMAARALGRSRRQEAAGYLAAHLNDDWQVAAHAATALRMLGPSGERELLAHEHDEGLAGILSRQMLWERRIRPEARSAA